MSSPSTGETLEEIVEKYGHFEQKNRVDQEEKQRMVTISEDVYNRLKESETEYYRLKPIEENAKSEKQIGETLALSAAFFFGGYLGGYGAESFLSALVRGIPFVIGGGLILGVLYIALYMLSSEVAEKSFLIKAGACILTLAAGAFISCVLGLKF